MEVFFYGAHDECGSDDSVDRNCCRESRHDPLPQVWIIYVLFDFDGHLAGKFLNATCAILNSDGQILLAFMSDELDPSFLALRVGPNIQL